MRIRKQKPKIITIFQDDREKNPWSEEYLGTGFEVVQKRLDTGDYTIKGMEEIVCIEKKADWAELLLNVSKTQYRKNFIKELRRMRSFPVRLLVVHADISKIITTRTFGNISPTILYGWVINIVIEYGVTLYPVGARGKAQPIIRELFKRIYEYNYNGRLYIGGTDD